MIRHAVSGTAATKILPGLRSAVTFRANMTLEKQMPTTQADRANGFILAEVPQLRPRFVYPLLF